MTPPEALALLAADLYSSDVRYSVAINPATPPEMLVTLSQDEHWAVRRGAVESPNVTRGMLARLSADSAPEVRVAVAEQKATPADVLAVLAGDESSEVAKRVARHPGTPSEALERLTRARDLSTSEPAAAAVASRICAALDVDPANAGAIDYLRDQAWWAMTPDDPAVVLARMLHPNG